MLYRILAEATMVVHFAFILFVIFGGALARFRGWLALAHLPAFAWGVLIMVFGWVCPLTPLENHFRAQAGLEGYHTGFIEHYILAIIYPEGLTRTHQILLGSALFAFNALVYGWLVRRWLSQSGGSAPPSPGDAGGRQRGGGASVRAEEQK